MSKKILAVTVCLAIAVVCCSEVSAQRAPLKLNQAFRYLGHGQSTGYHWRTPGPCVGYYNPYSRLNSELRIGGVPQGAQNYVPSYDQQFYVSPFDQPANFSNPSPTVAPNSIPTMDSEIDLEVYENDKDAVGEKENSDEDTSSILDEIESIENKSAPEAGQTEEDNIDGASLWSDVFELSRLQRNQAAARRSRNQRR